MNVKRAVLSGAMLWVAIFFEVSILMFGLQLEGDSYYIAHYSMLAVLGALAALFYFGKAGSPGIMHGFFAGLAMLFTGAVLDAIITVPLFVKDYSFFLAPAMLLGYMETATIAAYVGWANARFARTG